MREHAAVQAMLVWTDKPYDFPTFVRTGKKRPPVERFNPDFDVCKFDERVAAVIAQSKRDGFLDVEKALANGQEDAKT